APAALRGAGQRRALQPRRELPGQGLRGDEPDHPGELPVDPRAPGERQLRTPALRGVEAVLEPADRAARVQLPLPPGLSGVVSSPPGPPTRARRRDWPRARP